MSASKYKKRVLFVCLGNICRSPAAEGIFKAIVAKNGLEKEFHIDSAGTSGYHDGDLPDKRMRHHGALRGYTFDSISRRFTPKDFELFDIILAMDDNNFEDIIQQASNLESRSKVYRMVDFLQQLEHDHIHDPYYGGASGFELVMDLLEDASEGLLKNLQADS